MSMKELQKQTDANIRAKADLIWQIATHLVGLFKPHEYGKVILPMTVLKRFDDALKPTKDTVVAMAQKLDAQHPLPHFRLRLLQHQQLRFCTAGGRAGRRGEQL